MLLAGDIGGTKTHLAVILSAIRGGLCLAHET